MTGLRGFDRNPVGLPFALSGRGCSGVVPGACHDTIVAVPVDVAPFNWGWPHLFTHHRRTTGSEVIVMGPWAGGGGFSQGVDDGDMLARVPKGFDGLVWTDLIEIVAPQRKRCQNSS